jgi:hypothetical protein
MKKCLLNFFNQRRKIVKLKAVIKKLRSDSLFYENQELLRKVKLESIRAENILLEAKLLVEKAKKINAL